MTNIFDTAYTQNNAMWDIGRPDTFLIKTVKEKPITPCNALELGCGKGSDSMWLWKEGFNVTGIDYSTVAIIAANQKKTQWKADINFICTDIFDFTFPIDTYGLIYDRGFLLNVYKKITPVLPQLHTSLKKGGLWLSLLRHYLPFGGEANEQEIRDIFNPYFDILPFENIFIATTRDRGDHGTTILNIDANSAYKIIMIKKEL